MTAHGGGYATGFDGKDSFRRPKDKFGIATAYARYPRARALDEDFQRFISPAWLLRFTSTKCELAGRCSQTSNISCIPEAVRRIRWGRPQVNP
jgi:hypothetical protein